MPIAHWFTSLAWIIVWLIEPRSLRTLSESTIVSHLTSIVFDLRSTEKSESKLLECKNCVLWGMTSIFWAIRGCFEDQDFHPKRWFEKLIDEPMAYRTLNFSLESRDTWTDELSFESIQQPFELSYLVALLLHSILQDGAPIEFRKPVLSTKRSVCSNHLHWIPHLDFKD